MKSHHTHQPPTMMSLWPISSHLHPTGFTMMLCCYLRFLLFKALCNYIMLLLLLLQYDGCSLGVVML